MWIWDRALQWVQNLYPDLATSSSPSDERNRLSSARSYHPPSLQRRSRVSDQIEPSARVPRHWADGNIVMIFSQDGTIVESATNTWFAAVTIQANDLSKSMREGLYWNESNLDREAGYIIRNPQAVIHPHVPPHIRCARVYIFRDISTGDPSWTAQMTLLCPNLEAAAHFRFGNVRVDQIALCGARNQQGKDVYNFSREEGATNINTIYDYMPLEGWWPWPKRPDSGEDDLLL